MAEAAFKQHWDIQSQVDGAGATLVATHFSMGSTTLNGALLMESMRPIQSVCFRSLPQ
jgi:hypothetical protein